MKTYPMQLCITTQIQVFNNNPKKKKHVDQSMMRWITTPTLLIDSDTTILYCIVTKHQSICFSYGSSMVHALFVSHFSLQSSLHPYCRISIVRLKHISNLNSRVKKKGQNVRDQKLKQDRT